MANSTEDGPAGRPLLRNVALPAVFVGTAVALGFLLAPVPNVELVTFTIFAAGGVLGGGRGALVGALTAALYSGLNPAGSGVAIPTLFAAQVIAWALVGAAGGLTERIYLPLGRGADGLRTALSGGLGALLTLMYQGAVIVGLALAGMTIGGSGFAWATWRHDLAAALTANAFFSLVHVVSNAILFAVLAPRIMPRLRAFGRG
ncbi:MAG: hypothetical protein GF405_03805 [Candidatus Eisenbacteria bacterium]|nr:hypothetical protein [Candidatus Eisenbacteria bacterium]